MGMQWFLLTFIDQAWFGLYICNEIIKYKRIFRRQKAKMPFGYKDREPLGEFLTFGKILFDVIKIITKGNFSREMNLDKCRNKLKLGVSSFHH